MEPVYGKDSLKSSTPPKVSTGSLGPSFQKNLHESATPSNLPRLESPPVTPSSSGDSTASPSPSAAQMSDQPFPRFSRRSPRSATQFPPSSSDASRHNATSPEQPQPPHSYSPYTNYYPHYPPSSNIDPSLGTSPQAFGYPQFYQQGSHSTDPSHVSSGPGRPSYQPLVHSQSHYGQHTYTSDGASQYPSGRPSPHPFSQPQPSASGSQHPSSPAIYSGTNQFSTVQRFPPHTLQGTQYPYPSQPYSSSPHHQLYSPAPHSSAPYHATPAENEHGQRVGWWYQAPAGISMTPQYETSSHLQYPSHPQYTIPFNPHDQRYLPAGVSLASGGRSTQGTPRRGAVNMTNPSSVATALTTPPVLRRSDSAPSPTSPTYSQGSGASIPRRESHSAPSAPRTPSTPGASRAPAEKGRRAYHPNPPASRSEWVMWVGNVPPDATQDELWTFFSSPTPAEKEHLSAVNPLSLGAVRHPSLVPSSLAPPSSSSSRSSPSLGSRSSTASASGSSVPQSSAIGIVSIFLISRSSCAFVNYEDEPRLRNAIGRFNGQVLRPDDPKCPKLVCRERKREDDLKAGVGAQRGTGMHSKWIKEQKVKVASPAPISPGDEQGRHSPKPTLEHSEAESPDDESGSKSHRSNKQRRMSMSSSSGSYTSTTSSMLTSAPSPYKYDVDLSVKEGLWATQKHNEGVLDQAYRTSQDVYLIFSVNKSGEFYGYARMAGPVRGGEHSVSWASRTSSSRSSLVPLGPGSAKGSDSSLEQSSGSLPPPVAATSVPLPSTSHTKPPDTAHSMPELGDKSDSSSQRFLSPRENKGIAESPLSLTEDGDAEGGPPLPTITEESPGSTPPSDYDAARHTYPPNPPPRTRGEAQLDRQSFSAPPEFAATVRVLGGHTAFSAHSADDLQKADLPPTPLPLRSQTIKLDPSAPIRARRSPPESPEQDEALNAESPVVVKQEEDDDAALDMLKKLGRDEDIQIPSILGKKAEGTSREESWGEPFKIEWLCLQRLSFQRTRQIRNPWNHDREVKVSRDGTELEPVVGQRLLEEFHKLVEEQKESQSAGAITTANLSSGGDETGVGGDKQ